MRHGLQIENAGPSNRQFECFLYSYFLSVFFVFNYNADIKQGAYIHYRQEWFKVTRVDTTDDYNGEMFVYVKDTTDPTRASSGGGWW